MSIRMASIFKAIVELKAAGILPQQVELRQFKDLKNLIEQDHRLIGLRTPSIDNNAPNILYCN